MSLNVFETLIKRYIQCFMKVRQCWDHYSEYAQYTDTLLYREFVVRF